MDTILIGYCLCLLLFVSLRFYTNVQKCIGKYSNVNERISPSTMVYTGIHRRVIITTTKIKIVVVINIKNNGAEEYRCGFKRIQTHVNVNASIRSHSYVCASIRTYRNVWHLEYYVVE